MTVPSLSVTPPEVQPPPIRTEPLDLGCYGTSAVHELEMSSLLNPGAGPVFAALVASLPPGGHRRADGDDRVLLTTAGDGTVRAFANLCPHALRPLVGHGDVVTTACITCPFHEWSFRRDGSLVGGREFAFGASPPVGPPTGPPTGPAASGAAAPTRGELGLHEFEVLAWNGLLWTGGHAELALLGDDLARLTAAFTARGLGDWLDMESLTLRYREEETYQGDWKTFLEVYGDCYHVPAYHGGLSSYADCRTLEWSFGRGYHAQFVQLSARRGEASANYRAWVDGVDAYYRSRGEATPGLAVAWTSIYPNVMVELYNGMCVISIIVPRGADRYVNRVLFLFPADLDVRVPGLSATIKAAYDETAVEDRVLNESRAEGLAMARSLGLRLPTYVTNLAGPAPEAGTMHFHEWWRARVDRTAASG